VQTETGAECRGRDNASWDGGQRTGNRLYTDALNFAGKKKHDIQTAANTVAGDKSNRQG
jgi:hypothetical protein